MLTDEIKSSLDAGIPVSIFPEGAMTPNGETGFFSPRTGQLIKDSGAALITFKLTGGYMHAPKWAKHLRRGPVHGKVVAEYAPQQLAAMSADEVNALIRRDIYHNEYEHQAKNKKNTKAKILLNLSNAYCICVLNVRKSVIYILIKISLNVITADMKLS
ncbi:MAG: hypothetical protein UH249_10130 [Acutalibacteraceae bacterium]|nr:hypothetical protein [Acutalibacteraceae bacterium]